MAQGLTGVPQAAARSANVASATTVTLPAAPMDCTYPITGTTTITSITAGQIGRKATLEFASANCTVVNGSNLKLAGRSFISTVLRTLTLESDGTNWVEMGRGAFGTTVATTQNFADAASAGSVGEAADVGHVHAMPTIPTDNALYNVDFEVAQSGVTSAALVSGAVVLDGWHWSQAGDGTLFHARIDGSAATILGNINLASYSYIFCSTHRTTSAAGDIYILQQVIEGWNARHVVNGCAFSGWFYTTIAGTYGIALRTRGNTYSCIKEMTLPATTWTYFTTTFPTFFSLPGDFRSQVGAYFSICFAAGSTYQAAPNTWTAGNFVTTSNQVNFPLTDALPQPQLYMHGLNLIAGSTPQPYYPLPYDQILTRCQRYRLVYISPSINERIGTCYATSTTNAFGYIAFPTNMLAAPSMTLAAAGDIGVAAGTAATACTAVANSLPTTWGTTLTCTTAAVLTAGHGGTLYLTGGGKKIIFESYPT